VEKSKNYQLFKLAGLDFSVRFSFHFFMISDKENESISFIYMLHKEQHVHCIVLVYKKSNAVSIAY
jgi:hypothetical protein